MRYGRVRTREGRSQAGFSLIEVLAVAAIIAIMAAIAMPNIMGYLQQYTIRGASQEVARQVDAARMRAISSNTNRGVTFAVVDRDSYRWIREDLTTLEEQLGTLYDLPGALVFVAGGTTAQVRFNRLGASCSPGTAGCGVAFGTPCDAAEQVNRCNESPGNYVSLDAGSSVIVIRDTVRGLERRIRVSPGGRAFVEGL